MSKILKMMSSISGAFFSLLDDGLAVAMFVAGLASAYTGVRFFLAARSLAGLPGIRSIMFNQHFYTFLMAVNILSHSSKTIAVQVSMLHLFAIIASELALLSVMAGLYIIRKILRGFAIRVSVPAENLAIGDLSPKPSHSWHFGKTKDGMSQHI